MTRYSLAALALALGLAATASAYDGTTMNVGHNEVYASTTQLVTNSDGQGYAPCDDACDDCCGRWGLIGEAELLFFKYNRADGVRIGDGAGESGAFDYEAAYRLMGGVVGPGGLGARVRYFEFDNSVEIEDPGDGVFVDVYTIDFELFEAFEVSDCWSLEISGGIRYASFEEQMIDAAAGDFRQIDIEGPGLITGLEARRWIFGNASFFARTRLAVIEDDKHVLNTDGTVTGQDFELESVTAGMIEIAVGLEARRELASGSMLFARGALEYQNWWNFSNSFAGGVNGEALFEGPSDVGFSGFTLSAGLAY
jgi:hypothetical protein